MARHIAFLRGINVGGHTVKMAELRRVFESHGFSGVETVIASGNVVFESPAPGGRALEREVEAALEAALGFGVATFLRTPRELARVVERQPFAEEERAPGAVVYAVFLRDAPAPAARDALRAIATGNDEVGFGAREVYWLRRERIKESEQFAVLLGKALGADTTNRNMNTVRRIAERYCRDGGGRR